MHRDDVGMIETCDRASLGQVRLGIFRLRDQFGMRHLNGDVAIQLLIVRQIDEPEAPFAQHLLDAVTTDLLGMFDARSIVPFGSIPTGILRFVVRIQIVHRISGPVCESPIFANTGALGN